MSDNLSYVNGTGGQPLIYRTIGNMLDASATRWPAREALIVKHQGVRLSFAELNREVDAIAAGLLALGLQPGDRVGVWAPNCAEWVLAQYATAKAGLIQVNINPAYRAHELEYVLNKVECKALITAARFKSSDYLAMLRELAPELDEADPGGLSAEKLPALKAVIRIGADKTAGCINFNELPAMADDRHQQDLKALAASLQPDDPINIQFTSGTTGFPKGATLTHFNILNNGYFVGAAMRFSEHDRLCIPVPLYHCFGMVLGSLNCVVHGAAMIFPDEGFDPALTLQAVAEEKCTALYGVPTMFIAELDLPNFSDYDLSSLRTGIMAGASCPIEVMKRVISDMHMPEVTIAYGMTETSPVSFQSSTDDPIARRVATVGRILPHLEVKVIDENGMTVTRNDPGELCTRGYSLMRGYWNDAEKTSEAIDESGWMHTGDLATIDEEGYCRIVGRVKDMIIRGGENISPREIEEYLYTNDKIQDVSVFGVPDEKYGEEICAWVRLKDGAALAEEDIRAFCKDKIAHYKIPRYVRLVDEFPMTVTGKLQKFLMREQMIDELGLKIQETA